MEELLTMSIIEIKRYKIIIQNLAKQKENKDFKKR